MYFERRSKFNNKSTIYNGRSYHSAFEAGQAAELDLRMKAREFKDWVGQVRIPLTAHGRFICNYIVDFQVNHHDGTIEYIEAKGFETEIWRLKWKIFEAQLEEEVRLGTVKLTVVKEKSSWKQQIKRKSK